MGSVIRPGGSDRVACGAVLVTAQTHPLRDSSIRQYVVAEGRTLAAILEDAGFRPHAPVVVQVAGRRILPTEWAACAPAAGQLVVVRALAAGGGGDAGGKSAGRVLAMVAVLALTLVTGGVGGSLGVAGLVGATTEVAGLGFVATNTGLFINALAAATISVAGNLAVNALFPPPGLSRSPGATGNPLATGTRNRARPGEKIPRVYGTHRVYPDLAAEPWVEHLGKHSFLRLLFCFGHGPLELSELRIGNEPLLAASTSVTYTGEIRADGHYKGVRLEVRKGTGSDAPITLYPQDVHTDSGPIELRGRDGTTGSDARNAMTRTTQRDTTEFSIDLSFPYGLVFTRASGTRDDVTIRIKCEYRPVGGSWLPFPDDEDAGIEDGVATITGKQVDPLYWGASVKPAAAGQYEVRLTRTTPKAGDSAQQDRTYWTALRSIKAGTPVRRGDVCLVAMRIRSSGQLNGTVDQFSAVATSVLRRWNGSAWVTEATGNAGAVYTHLLTGGETRITYADADTDMDGLKAAMVRCASERRECNLVFEGSATLFERLRIVAATMRAGFALLDGKPSLLFDDEPSTKVNHFCPENSFGFRGTKIFTDLPHALRCSFRDPAKDWELVERIVYADGYNADGSGGKTAATKFDAMEFPGYTNPRLVWMDARYHMAVARLRSEQFELHTDFEHLVARRGAFVTLSHHVIDTGIHSARILAVETDGSGDCTHITIEGSVVMDGGESYGVVVRKSVSGLTQITRQVVTVAGRQDRFEFSTPIPAASPHPVPGDIVTVGILGEETLECLVRSIEPEADLGARLTLVPLARDVYDADQATPPEWAVDRIAGDVPASSREPADTSPPPVVQSVSSATSPAASSSTAPAPSSPATTAPQPTPTTGTSTTTGSVTIQVKPPAGPKKPKPKGGKGKGKGK